MGQYESSYAVLDDTKKNDKPMPNNIPGKMSRELACDFNYVLRKFGVTVENFDAFITDIDSFTEYCRTHDKSPELYVCSQYSWDNDGTTRFRSGELYTFKLTFKSNAAITCISNCHVTKPDLMSAIAELGRHKYENYDKIFRLRCKLQSLLYAITSSFVADEKISDERYATVLKNIIEKFS